jgi:DNA-binding NarL/FixJ family response regulator
VKELTRTEVVVADLNVDHDIYGIAEKLCIEVSTVRTHLHKCYLKTGAHSQKELAVYWLRKNPDLL